MNAAFEGGNALITEVSIQLGAYTSQLKLAGYSFVIASRGKVVRLASRLDGIVDKLVGCSCWIAIVNESCEVRC